MNIYLKPKIFRALKLSTLCLILGVEAGFATESYSQKTVFNSNTIFILINSI